MGTARRLADIRRGFWGQREALTRLELQGDPGPPYSLPTTSSARSPPSGGRSAVKAILDPRPPTPDFELRAAARPARRFRAVILMTPRRLR
jgi:hypothetical protein